MSRQGIFLAVCLLAMTGHLWSDEPGRNEKDQNRSVSPVAPIEYTTRPKVRKAKDVTLPPVSLDDLVQLAAQLKSAGDRKSAELLARYVREQQSVTTASASAAPLPQAAATLDPIWIEIEVFEVNENEIPQEMNFRQAHPTALQIKHAREKLGRMVAEKKATVAISLQSLETQLNNEVSYFEKRGEFEVPVTNQDGTVTPAKREVGMKAQITARLKSTGMIELTQIVEHSQIDEKNSVEFLGKKVPGLRTRRIESTNETIAGQPVLLSGIGGLYVFTTVNPKADDTSAERAEGRE